MGIRVHRTLREQKALKALKGLITRKALRDLMVLRVPEDLRTLKIRKAHSRHKGVPGEHDPLTIKAIIYDTGLACSRRFTIDAGAEHSHF
jgi:hypothetical protein